MRDFPQELVDMVIDHLVERTPRSEIPDHSYLSEVSTVSRRWLERAQKRHFSCVQFFDQDDAQKWRTTFEADPSGVSRHVRELRWTNIETLEGFDAHLLAFTGVQKVDLLECGILGSLSEVQSFAVMGSTLVRLEIDGGLTTRHIMASLLDGLPRLRHLLAHDLEVEPDRSPAESPPSIPFFDGANAFSLLRRDYLPRKLDWIPPTARFCGLWIETLCIRRCSALVEQWLAGSGGNLKWLTIVEDSLGTSISRLDLSKSTYLNYLRLPVPLTQPGRYADVIFPSISSSRLSTVVLELCAPEAERIHYGGWEAMDEQLCRLAKLFKGAHDGREMKVQICVPSHWEFPVFDQLKNELPMPKLKEEAITAVLGCGDPLELGPEPWYHFSAVPLM